MAYIALSKKTSTSLTVFLQSLDSGYKQKPRTCKWYITKNDPDSSYEFKGSMNLPNEIFYSANYEIISLEPKTSYLVKAVITAEGWTNPKEVVLTNVFETAESSVDPGPDPPEPPPDEDKPQPFQWSAQALEAFTTNGPTSELTAEEWNTYLEKHLNKVNKIDLNKAKAKRGQFLTAELFNYVASATPMYDTKVRKNQVCEGQMFIDMVDAYNKYIKI